MNMVGSTGLTKDGGYGYGFFYLMMHSDTQHLARLSPFDTSIHSLMHMAGVFERMEWHGMTGRHEGERMKTQH